MRAKSRHTAREKTRESWVLLFDIIFINFENYINIFSKDNHNYNKLHQLEGKHPKSNYTAEEE